MPFLFVVDGMGTRKCSVGGPEQAGGERTGNVSPVLARGRQ